MGRPVVQWQILAKQPEAAARFYSGLFGWSVNADNPLGYRRIETGAGRGLDGGIWPSPPEGKSFVQLFVEVENAAETVERAVAMGARVVIPPQTLPEGDVLAVLTDPEGIPFGVMQGKAQ